MNSEEFDSLIADIAFPAEFEPHRFEVSRLEGFTNFNYRLRRGEDDWVLRIPRTETDRFIDREAEAYNQALACGLGIAPCPSWRNASGVTLTRIIAPCRKPLNKDLGERQTLEPILESVKRLHRSKLAFRGRVDLPALLRRYFEMLESPRRETLLPRIHAAEEILPRIAASDANPVPSHNDLVLENILQDGQKTWLIDWEYSSMASPYWDLATLCNSARLDDAQSRDLLKLYCADSARLKDSLLSDYRMLLQLLSDCWMAALAG